MMNSIKGSVVLALGFGGRTQVEGMIVSCTRPSHHSPYMDFLSRVLKNIFIGVSLFSICKFSSSEASEPKDPAIMYFSLQNTFSLGEEKIKNSSNSLAEISIISSGIDEYPEDFQQSTRLDLVYLQSLYDWYTKDSRSDLDSLHFATLVLNLAKLGSCSAINFVEAACSCSLPRLSNSTEQEVLKKISKRLQS